SPSWLPSYTTSLSRMLFIAVISLSTLSGSVSFRAIFSFEGGVRGTSGLEPEPDICRSDQGKVMVSESDFFISLCRSGRSAADPAALCMRDRQIKMAPTSKRPVGLSILFMSRPSRPVTLLLLVGDDLHIIGSNSVPESHGLPISHPDLFHIDLQATFLASGSRAVAAFALTGILILLDHQVIGSRGQGRSWPDAS